MNKSLFSLRGLDCSQGILSPLSSQAIFSFSSSCRDVSSEVSSQSLSLWALKRGGIHLAPCRGAGMHLGFTVSHAALREASMHRRRNEYWLMLYACRISSFGTTYFLLETKRVRGTAACCNLVVSHLCDVCLVFENCEGLLETVIPNSPVITQSHKACLRDFYISLQYFKKGYNRSWKS